MAYIYESIQTGIFNFTIPGKNKTIQLFLGNRIEVDQLLTGGYLRVLKLVGETVEEVETKEEVETPKKVITKPTAKVEDKITEVKEVIETPKETVDVKATDVVKNVVETTETPKVDTPISKKRVKKN